MATKPAPTLTQAQLHTLAEYFELLAEIEADIESITTGEVQ